MVGMRLYYLDRKLESGEVDFASEIVRDRDVVESFHLLSA